MNLEFFIAKKINFESRKRKFSDSILNISIIGVAVSIAIMIISVAISTGFKKEIKSKLVDLNSHIVLSNLQNHSSVDRNPLPRTLSYVKHIKNIPEIKYVQPFCLKPTLLKSKNEIQGLTLKGVDKQYNWRSLKKYMIEGKVLNLSSKKKNEIIISKYIAEKLNLKLGDKLNATFFNPQRFRRFKIVGIYETGMLELDKVISYVDIRHIQKLNKWNQNEIFGFEIFLKDIKTLKDTESKIKLSMIENFDENEHAIKVRGVDRIFPNFFGWLEILNTNVGVILTLLILVAAINMMSGLLILILDRVNMIGVLKAVGTSNYSIRKVFLYLGSFITLKGMIWGNIIGISLCLIQKWFHLLELDPTQYSQSVVPVNLNILHILALNAGTLILIYVILIIPSYIITKVKPVKALKFD